MKSILSMRNWRKSLRSHYLNKRAWADSHRRVQSNSETKCNVTLGYFCCVICNENCESAKKTNCSRLSFARNFDFTLLNSANSSFLGSSGSTQQALYTGKFS